MAGSPTILGIANVQSSTNRMVFGTASVTRTFGIGTAGGGTTVDASGTEARIAQKCRASGTLDQLYINTAVNSRSDATTFSSRVNSAAGAMAASVGATTTGVFSDLVNSDSVSSSTADLFNAACTTGSGTGALVMNVLTERFTPSAAGTVQIWAPFSTSGSGSTSVNNSLLTGSATRYWGWGGGSSSGGGTFNTTVEANIQALIRTAATLQNLQINASSNGRTTATTVTHRLNGADGASTVSITASTSGLFEDATHTDSVASGDFTDISTVTGSGSSTTTVFSRASATVVASGGSSDVFSGAIPAGASTTADLTYAAVTDFYVPALGSMFAFSGMPEANAYSPIGFGATVSNMRASVLVNASSGWTETLRIGGVDGAQTYSVGASATGSFEDAVHTDSVSAGNYIDIHKTSNNVQIRMGQRGLTINSNNAVSSNLTGQSATGAAGDLANTVSEPLLGAAAAATVGSVTPTTADPLPSAAGTGAAGTLTPSIGYDTPLSGISGTGSAGSFTQTISEPLTGAYGTGAAGTLFPAAASPTQIVPVLSLMRDIPVPVIGAMSDLAVGVVGDFPAEIVAVLSAMRNAPVPALGAISNLAVGAEGAFQ